MRLYPIVIDTSDNAAATTVPAGGSVTMRVPVDRGTSRYTIRKLYGMAFLGAVVGSAPIGTALPRESETDSAATPVPSLNQVRYALKFNQDQQQKPLLLSAVASPGALMFEPAGLPELDPNQTLEVTFYNDSSVIVRARLELHGTYES